MCIRQFRTRHFVIDVEAYEYTDLDLSFDADGSIRAKLDNGELVAFQVEVHVYYNGHKVGSDYLGGCVYESIEEFQDHRECGKQNRQWAAQGISTKCGSYFRDMIHEAIAQARKTLSDRPYIRTTKEI